MMILQAHTLVLFAETQGWLKRFDDEELGVRGSFNITCAIDEEHKARLRQ